jgi:hypothetical protein
MKLFFASCILTTFLTLFSVSGYSQTTITSVPYTITAPGTYVFANNLTYSLATGDAITVNVSNVTIDLNGYYLYCSASGSANGIYFNNKANIRVKNGEVVGFGAGIFADHSVPAPTLNVNFGQLIEGVRFYNNSYAMSFFQSTCAVVKNCQFIGGTNGVTFTQGTGNRAIENLASKAYVGFYSDGTDYFESNYADGCTFGIYATSSKLRFNATTNCTTGVTGGTSELANDQ